LRDIIKQARQVGVLANDQKILSMCDDLEKKVDKLSALRSQGLVCNTCNTVTTITIETQSEIHQLSLCECKR